VRRPLLALLIVVVLPACGGGSGEGEPAAVSGAVTFSFVGGDVADGEAIDVRFTCDGENVSPALAWEAPPAGSVEQALVVDDPDAPGDGFVHWVAFGISPDRTELAVGSPDGLVQGANDAGGTGWTGPCPPEGETHGYVFTLYALDAETGLEEGASLDDLRAAMDGHVVGEATLTAPYTRSSR
jgi:Raf kinase inhibitor-like YbhB/YbcL family protein